MWGASSHHGMAGSARPTFIAIAKSFFRYGKPYNPPCPPLKKGGNCKELLAKFLSEKGGVKNLHAEGIYGKRYKSYQFFILFQKINRYRPDLISPCFC